MASLWEGYPHTGMTFLFKFFFIIQLSYWLHVFPELYFQKTKREDWAPKIQHACLYIAFILGAYVTSFTRVALFLLLVHYLSEVVFHTCRILAYLNQTAVASKLFKLGDLLFVLARLSSVILAVLTFWFGLASLPAELQVGRSETTSSPGHTVHHLATQFITLPYSSSPCHTVRHLAIHLITLPYSSSPCHTVHHLTI